MFAFVKYDRIRDDRGYSISITHGYIIFEAVFRANLLQLTIYSVSDVHF